MSLDTKQLVQPIRDSKRLVQLIPVERKLDFQYLGKDGRTYSTSEELHQADEDWKKRTFPKKD